MTTFEKLQRRIGGFPIEYPAAALMAGAVALCTLALPDWRFESAVNASGLPAIISAAQPPLGATARIIVALALATLSFLAVWFGLRALDAKPQTSDFPAFRAADLHPDAPRRRPILAGAEFGAPADDLPPIEDQIKRRRPLVSEPLPSFLAPQPPAIGDFMHEAAAEPRYVEIKDDPEPVADAAPEPFVAPLETVRIETARVEPGRIETARVEPAPIEIVPVEVLEDRQVARSDPPAEIAAQRPRSFIEEPVAPVRPTITAAFADPQEEESVSELMARLETGLSERGSKPMPGPSGAAKEELRRALGDLNRVSGRG